MIHRVLVAALLLLTLEYASATDVSAVAGIGQVLIDVPNGLIGPDRSAPNKQTEIEAYAGAANVAPVVLQLAWVRFPEARTDLSETDRYEAASSFLDGFLVQFSRNVSGWTRTKREVSRLDGFVAARATWSGDFHGFPARGVMYFLVMGKDSYCFHAFGRSDVPNVTLQAAIQAIERAHIGR